MKTHQDVQFTRYIIYAQLIVLILTTLSSLSDIGPVANWPLLPPFFIIGGVFGSCMMFLFLLFTVHYKTMNINVIYGILTSLLLLLATMFAFLPLIE